VATTPAEVRTVVLECRAAGPDDVEWLRDVALRSPDPLVAGNALRALGGIVSIAGDEELTALLVDPRLRLRQEAVIALGRSRDPAALPLLEEVLERGEPETAPLAQYGVNHLGD
jgi:HEAT repeat protein